MESTVAEAAMAGLLAGAAPPTSVTVLGVAGGPP
jgi:hypothetical protein